MEKIKEPACITKFKNKCKEQLRALMKDYYFKSIKKPNLMDPNARITLDFRVRTTADLALFVDSFNTEYEVGKKVGVLKFNRGLIMELGYIKFIEDFLIAYLFNIISYTEADDSIDDEERENIIAAAKDYIDGCNYYINYVNNKFKAILGDFEEYNVHKK